MFTKRSLVFVLVSLSLLLVPFLAMQFHVGGWDWKLADFAIIGVLLVGVGFGLAAATNKAFPLSRRIIGIVCVCLLVLLYVHLAVGIVDTWPFAGS